MNNIKLRINELLELQPGLKYEDGIIEGEIILSLHAQGFYLDSKYHIKIIINYEFPFLSEVYETAGAIKPNYEHIYENGLLCLSTPIDLILSEDKDGSILGLYIDYIEPYFFSYEYFERYGFFPFGERKHGLFGVLDSYCDIIGMQDYAKVLSLLQKIAFDKYRYRGHLPCPCGSKLKTRNCHPKISKLFLNGRIVEQVKKDYNTMELVINECKRKAKQ